MFPVHNVEWIEIMDVFQALPVVALICGLVSFFAFVPLLVGWWWPDRTSPAKAVERKRQPK